MTASRLRLAVAALALLFLASGCQVAVEANVRVRQDGSGVVEAGVGLDAEALAQVGDLSQAVRVDDLREAGWRVSGPTAEDDGLTWMRVSKPFAEVSQAEGVLAELTGADGPFRGMKVERTRSLARTRTSVTGVVDLTGGLSGFVDPDLRARLGDLDPTTLVPAGTVTVELGAYLPGSLLHEGGEPVSDGVVWRPVVGQQLNLSASGTAFEPVPVVPGLVALVAATAALVITRRRRAQQVGHRHRRLGWS